jgi:hypothetical protein
MKKIITTGSRICPNDRNSTPCDRNHHPQLVEPDLGYSVTIRVTKSTLRGTCCLIVVSKRNINGVYYVWNNLHGAHKSATQKDNKITEILNLCTVHVHVHVIASHDYKHFRPDTHTHTHTLSLSQMIIDSIITSCLLRQKTKAVSCNPSP